MVDLQLKEYLHKFIFLLFLNIIKLKKNKKKKNDNFLIICTYIDFSRLSFGRIYITMKHTCCAVIMVNRVYVVHHYFASRMLM